MSNIKTLADLTPDPKNARRHTPRNVGMIEQAMGEVGAARSIVIDEDGVVLAGNATIEAAAQAGIERVQVVDADGETIVAVRRSGLTAEQKTKLALFDNRASELADWDAGVLASFQEEIDLSALFRPDEWAAILEEAAQPVDIGGAGDDFDTTPQDGPTRTQVGELWEIDGGRHRLLVGDCTDAANVERLMGGERAAAVVTDPPYGINVDTGWLSALHIQRGKPANKSDDRLANDDGSLDLAWVFGYPQWLVFGFPFVARHEQYTGLLVWDKRGDGGEGGLGTPVEVAASNAFNGYRLARHVWAGYVREAGETRQPHPTQKPIGIITDAIELVKGDIILDPFLGSGTTLIAAHQTGRRCYGMEISPRYADVILRRAEAAGLSVARREE